MADDPSFTVAICTWNRCDQLASTLSRLAESRPLPQGGWHVLVVNNACTDDTSRVITSFEGKLPIRETYEPRLGVTHARNRALAEAAGSYVAFIDDDVFVDPGWLATFERLAKTYSDCDVFAGPVRACFETPPAADLLAAFPYLRQGFCALDLHQPEGVLQTGQLPAGANMGFRLAAVQDIEFAADLGPVGDRSEGHEDVDFVRRVLERGGRTVWSPRLSVQHYVASSRMEVDYLLQLEANRVRTRIRSAGRPPGSTLRGIPAATLLGRAMAQVVFTACRLVGSRRQQLVWKVRCHRFTAKVSEYLAIRQRPLDHPRHRSVASLPDR